MFRIDRLGWFAKLGIQPVHILVLWGIYCCLASASLRLNGHTRSDENRVRWACCWSLILCGFCLWLKMCHSMFGEWPGFASIKDRSVPNREETLCWNASCCWYWAVWSSVWTAESWECTNLKTKGWLVGSWSEASIYLAMHLMTWISLGRNADTLRQGPMNKIKAMQGNVSQYKALESLTNANSMLSLLNRGETPWSWDRKCELLSRTLLWRMGWRLLRKGKVRFISSWGS